MYQPHVANLLPLALVVLSLGSSSVDAKREKRQDGEEEAARTLYDAAEPMLQLHAATFDAAVYEQPTALFVEFYSAWCGSCIEFAPVWTHFARNVKQWRSVVKAAVVNCALDENTVLCRDHRVDHTPTIKYFKYRSRSPADGADCDKGSKHNDTELSEQLAKFVLADWQAQKPTEWPSFQQLSSLPSVADLFSSGALNFVVSLAESETSLLGSQILLDYSAVPDVTVFRVKLLANESPDTRILDIYSRQTSESHKASFSLRGSELSRMAVLEEIRKITNSGPILEAALPAISPPPSPIVSPQSPYRHLNHFDRYNASTTFRPDRNTQYQVHLTDLMSALSYMFQREIPLKQTFTNEQTKALEAFLRLLAMHFPGLPPTRRLLIRMHSFVEDFAKSDKTLTGDVWTQRFEQVQELLGRPLPLNATWLACKGSTATFRGYPCGLWTTFHALTVAAFNRNGADADFDALATVEAVHGYVKHFFGCEQCVLHFERSAVKIPQEVTAPRDAVLWLWKSHNRANHFLKGTASEDPTLPKQPFPPTELCADCQPDGYWDEAAVLRFLQRFYASVKMTDRQLRFNVSAGDGRGGLSRYEGALDLNPRFRQLGQDMTRDEAARQRAADEERVRAREREWMAPRRGAAAAAAAAGWLGWTGVDASICFVLWFGSLLIVLALCVVLRLRRRKSKLWMNLNYRRDFNV